VNSDDPRDWGEDPIDDVERLLCRADEDGVAALVRWLVDGAPFELPAERPGSARAVAVAALG